MGKDNLNIFTGVDKLISLIDKKGKLSLNQASKILGVSQDVVEEWAHFLEQKELIEIKYFLTNVYLIKKELTKKQIKKKENILTIKNQTVVRRAENFISNLTTKFDSLSKLKEDYENLREDIEKQSFEVKKHFDEMEQFEAIKRKIETGISPDQVLMRIKVDRIKRDVSIFSEKLKKLSKSTKSEIDEIKKREIQSDHLLKEESEIYYHLEHLENTIKSLKKQVMENAKFTEKEKNKLNYYSKRIKIIQKGVNDKKQVFFRYTKQIIDSESKAETKYALILSKFVKSKKFSKSDFKKIKEKLEKAKAKVNKMNLAIKDVFAEYSSIIQELHLILAEAKSLKHFSGNSNGINDLGKKLEEINTKRKLFEEHLDKLKLIIKKE